MSVAQTIVDLKSTLLLLKVVGQHHQVASPVDGGLVQGRWLHPDVPQVDRKFQKRQLGSDPAAARRNNQRQENCVCR